MNSLQYFSDLVSIVMNLGTTLLHELFSSQMTDNLKSAVASGHAALEVIESELQVMEKQYVKSVHAAHEKLEKEKQELTQLIDSNASDVEWLKDKMRQVGRNFLIFRRRQGSYGPTRQQNFNKTVKICDDITVLAQQQRFFEHLRNMAFSKFQVLSDNQCWVLLSLIEKPQLPCSY